MEKTLTQAEVNLVHNKIAEAVRKIGGVVSTFGLFEDVVNKYHFVLIVVKPLSVCFHDSYEVLVIIHFFWSVPHFQDIVKSMTVKEVMDEGEDNRSSDGDNEMDDGGGREVSNSAWVDSISRILNTKKPKKKKHIVLSKAKTLTDLKKKKNKPVGFEVETADGKVKKEVIEELEDTVPVTKKKKKDILKLRVKPDILERDRERTLQKIATKGVVQLFNAVKMQQKDISMKLKEAGPLEVRKEKVLKNIDKRAFLDVLMGEKSEKVEMKDVTWSVLKEDFMMTAKMKDWDKEMECETEDVEQVVESD
nr:unnamed protein product [Callosobruchus analis]